MTVLEVFMDEYKAAPGDWGRNRYNFLSVFNIEWANIKMAGFHHYFIVEYNNITVEEIIIQEM